MITRTLAQLRSQVSRFLDEPISSDADDRHTVANANVSINNAIERYQLLLADTGISSLSRATLTTSSSSADVNGWPANRVLALPSDLMLLKSLSIYESGQWIPMVQFDEPERDDYETWLGSQPSLPTHYRIGTDSTSALILRLMPASDSAYSVRCLYVPTPNALSDDADTHRFLEGTSEWVELEAAVDMLGEDGVPEPGQLNLWRTKQARCEELILKFKNLGQGPRRKQNTREMRALAAVRSGPFYRGIT